MDNVLVTGIGGNVGYGILKNIISAFPDIRLIGTNTSKVSAGNHLCHAVYEVPFSTDDKYIPSIKAICHENNVRLIIPSTDYESYILSLNKTQLPPVACSSPEAGKTFLDKYESYLFCHKNGLPFAESILPGNYNNALETYIVKPREGRGSRDVYINPANPAGFSNDFIIQPFLTGKEITTAFYVTKQNALLGLITLERTLSAGTTMMCEVTTLYDTVLTGYINKLISLLDIKGACNIQCIVTENGIIPFEVNCRVSGTNSIRSQFGFKDVEYIIDEYLYNKPLKKPEISTGSALRILYDIIYPGKKVEEIDNNTDLHYING
jgi:carbamoyl-phosphate synthase large subunit